MPPTAVVNYTAKGSCRRRPRWRRRARVDDGRLDVKLSSSGTTRNGTNPEHLIAAGWSAWFLSAIKLAAAKGKIKPPSEVAIDGDVDSFSFGKFCIDNEVSYYKTVNPSRSRWPFSRNEAAASFSRLARRRASTGDNQ